MSSVWATSHKTNTPLDLEEKYSELPLVQLSHTLGSRDIFPLGEGLCLLTMSLPLSASLLAWYINYLCLCLFIGKSKALDLLAIKWKSNSLFNSQHCLIFSIFLINHSKSQLILPIIFTTKSHDFILFFCFFLYLAIFRLSRYFKKYIYKIVISFISTTNEKFSFSFSL